MKTADRIAADIAGALLIGLGKSLRFEEEGREHLQRARATRRPVLFIFWHDRLLYCCFRLAAEGLVMMVSRSRDGDRIARAASHLGIEAVRGSSSRGGPAAARELARVMRDRGLCGGITPDGPRGPRHALQPGALLVAKLSGAVIVPVAIGFRRKLHFTRNAGIYLPWPFTRAVFVFGEPFDVRADADSAALAALRPDTERRLREVTEAADRPFAGSG